MIISTLLQTALMKNAKVICGNTGLSNEVTWCAPDTSIAVSYTHLMTNALPPITVSRAFALFIL